MGAVGSLDVSDRGFHVLAVGHTGLWSGGALGWVGALGGQTGAFGYIHPAVAVADLGSDSRELVGEPDVEALRVGPVDVRNFDRNIAGHGQGNIELHCNQLIIVVDEGADDRHVVVLVGDVHVLDDIVADEELRHAVVVDDQAKALLLVEHDGADVLQTFFDSSRDDRLGLLGFLRLPDLVSELVRWCCLRCRVQNSAREEGKNRQNALESHTSAFQKRGW